MDQRTHTWIACRSIALLEDENQYPRLVRLLKPHVQKAAIGSWLPDLRSSKLGMGDTDNHTFKITPMKASEQAKRFIADKDDLIKRLGPKRKISVFLKKDKKLSSKWWNTPYKAYPQPGEHIPNAVMSLREMLVDLLSMGDPNLFKVLPGRIAHAGKLPKGARTNPEQAALYFFMASHFIADASMPCHCDDRWLAGYERGLHKELEKHWARKIGGYFDKKKLMATGDSPNAILKKARVVDQDFGLSFGDKVSKMKKGKDAWKDMVDVCRASFALASIISPPDDYPYGGKKLSPFKECFAEDTGAKLLTQLDEIAMHDSVYNVAMIWKDIWSEFISLEKRQQKKNEKKKKSKK